MEPQRKLTIFGFLGILAFLIGLLALNLVMGEVTRGFLWAFPVGILFGAGMCIYLSETWDPVQLRPKNPAETWHNSRIYWSVPLGILVVNIISRLFSREVGDLLVGCFEGFLYVTLSYIVFQAWWHRPRG